MFDSQGDPAATHWPPSGSSPGPPPLPPVPPSLPPGCPQVQAPNEKPATSAAAVITTNLLFTGVSPCRHRPRGSEGRMILSSSRSSKKRCKRPTYDGFD
jgi:hypothetical protein